MTVGIVTFVKIYSKSGRSSQTCGSLRILQPTTETNMVGNIGFGALHSLRSFRVGHPPHSLLPLGRSSQTCGSLRILQPTTETNMVGNIGFEPMTFRM